jgi:hypothetical protein
VTKPVPTIARHEIDTAAADADVELLGSQLEVFVDLAKYSPDALNGVLQYSLYEVGYRTAGDPAASWSDTWNAVVRAMQAGSAIFELANHPGEEVSFRLGDETIQRKGVGPFIEANAFNWIRAMYLAMICRERERIDALAATPIEVLRASGLEYDEYLYSWVRVWQTYWRQEDGLVDLILETMRGTDPAGLRHISEDMTLKLNYPPVEMFYQLTQRDEEKFNDSLANALELHQQYWTATPERRTDPNGYLALGPLAVACLARDAGLTITVVSDYLPRTLLEGGRVGEVST